jgi:hypothetical protein
MPQPFTIVEKSYRLLIADVAVNEIDITEQINTSSIGAHIEMYVLYDFDGLDGDLEGSTIIVNPALFRPGGHINAMSYAAIGYGTVISTIGDEYILFDSGLGTLAALSSYNQYMSVKALSSTQFEFRHRFQLTKDLLGFLNGSIIDNASRLLKNRDVNLTELSNTGSSVYIDDGKNELQYAMKVTKGADSVADIIGFPFTSRFYAMNVDGDPSEATLDSFTFTRDTVVVSQLSIYEDTKLEFKVIAPSTSNVTNVGVVAFKKLTTGNSYDYPTDIFLNETIIEPHESETDQLDGILYMPCTADVGGAFTEGFVTVKASELELNAQYYFIVIVSIADRDGGIYTNSFLKSMVASAPKPGLDFTYDGEFFDLLGQQWGSKTKLPPEMRAGVFATISKTDYDALVDASAIPYGHFSDAVASITIDVIDDATSAILLSATINKLAPGIWTDHPQLKVNETGDSVVPVYLFKTVGNNASGIPTWINKNINFRWSLKMVDIEANTTWIFQFTEELTVYDYYTKANDAEINYYLTNPETGETIYDVCSLPAIDLTFISEELQARGNHETLAWRDSPSFGSTMPTIGAYREQDNWATNDPAAAPIQHDMWLDSLLEYPFEEFNAITKEWKERFYTDELGVGQYVRVGFQYLIIQDSEDTRMQLRIAVSDEIGMSFDFDIVGDAINIDWGDGSALENVSSTTANHMYSVPGEYIVKFEYAGLTEINVSGNRIIEIIRCADTLTHLTCAGPNTTAVSHFSPLLEYIALGSNINLHTIPTIPTPCVFIEIYSCGFSEAAIYQILVDLVANGQLNGYYDFSGQTPTVTLGTPSLDLIFGPLTVNGWYGGW